MADSNGLWQSLNWEKRLAISEQGIANEDSLLHTYVIIFIALQAMLFGILIAKGWGQWWSALIAFIGIGIALWFMYLFENRGNTVDLWGEILYGLWGEAGKQELAERYKGCWRRRENRKKRCGRLINIVGWGSVFERKRYGSARRVITTFMPLILVIVWILVTVVSFDC